MTVVRSLYHTLFKRNIGLVTASVLILQNRRRSNSISGGPVSPETIFEPRHDLSPPRRDGMLQRLLED